MAVKVTHIPPKFNPARGQFTDAGKVEIMAFVTGGRSGKKSIESVWPHR